MNQKQPGGPILAIQGGLVLAHKPPGVLSVPGRGQGQARTILHLVQDALSLPTLPLPCHRLDQATSGVMVVALDTAAQRLASAEFEHHRVRKAYLAWVAGILPGVTVVDAPLGADPEAPSGLRARQRVQDDGKPARTLCVPLWSGGGATLVAARPSTGRTHQVRVHLAHVGHPLFGDTMYGGPPAPRAMLHAAYVALRMPDANVVGAAPVWPDLGALLDAAGCPRPNPEDVDAALTRAARAAVAGNPPPR
jgi:tRNA pseudouridine32 synthase/23S rRNA pseudouridine746 synthase